MRSAGITAQQYSEDGGSRRKGMQERDYKEERSMTEQRNGLIQSSSIHYGHLYYVL